LYILKFLFDVIESRVFMMFSYEPYFGLYGEISSDKLVIGYAMLLPLWLPIRTILVSEKYALSRVLVAFQFFLVVLPSLTTFAQSERPAFHLALILLGFYTFVLATYLMPRFKLPYLPPGAVLPLILLFGGISVYVYVMLLITGGLGRINFDLSSVYETREQYVEAPFPLAAYFVSWLANVLNISLLIYSFIFSKKWLTFLAILAQIALFAMTNFKSHLFLLLFSPMVYLALRSFRASFAVLALLGMASLSAAVAVSGSDFLLSLFRRVFYVPAGLSSLYFDYFSQNSLSFMSGSSIGKILYYFGLDLPYTTSSVTVVALEYWGRDFSPNVNWIGASFADFGILGIVFSGIFLGFLAALGDSVSKLLCKRGIAESISLGLGFSLTNSALITSLFTHGGILSLISIWLIASLGKSTCLVRGRELHYDK